MTKRKILVTGGAGYIGAHTVVELFEAGFEPVIVDNFSKVIEPFFMVLKRLLAKNHCYAKETVLINFLESVFRENSISAVFHFAAFKSVGESVQKPLEYYQNNLNSLMTILQVMLDVGVKDFVFSSSCTVYGQPDQIPVDETAPFKKAESPYGSTKQMCEQILQDVYSTGFKIISLRYFNPIGAHPSSFIGELPLGVPNNLIPYITQTAIGRREKLIVFGSDYDTPDGSCLRDFIHVVDLAQAHVKALAYLDNKTEKVCFDAFNVGTGKGVSVLELINEFQHATGVNLNYIIGPRRPGDVEKTYADPTKAFRELNWMPKFSNKEALAHAWNWEKKLAGK